MLEMYATLPKYLHAYSRILPTLYILYDIYEKSIG